jgi:hypothetical protein
MKRDAIDEEVNPHTLNLPYSIAPLARPAFSLCDVDGVR